MTSLSDHGTNTIEWFFTTGTSDKWTKVADIDWYKNWLLTKYDQKEYIVSIVANGKEIWRKEGEYSPTAEMQKQLDIIDVGLQNLVEGYQRPVKSVFDEVEHEFFTAIYGKSYAEEIRQVYQASQLKVLKRFVEQKFM